MFGIICCLTSFLQVSSLIQTGMAQPADTSEQEEDVSLDTTIAVSIHRSLPKYYIRIVESVVPPDTDQPDMQFMNYKLLVRSRKTGPVLQTIEESATVAWDNPPTQANGSVPGIFFEDVNFDGYLDLEIWGGADAHYQVGWGVYLFNPDSLKFIGNKQLSDLAYGAGLDLDPAKKQITRRYEGGCRECEVVETYQLSNNTWVLVSRKEAVPHPSGPGYFIITRQELINGVLTQTGKDTLQESETDY